MSTWLQLLRWIAQSLAPRKPQLNGAPRLSKRSAVLFAFRELLHANQGELAKIITADHGKVLADAGGEIARGLENVEFACGVQLMKGGFSEQVDGVDVYSIRQPLGVVAGIRVQLSCDGPALDVCQRNRP